MQIHTLTWTVIEWSHIASDLWFHTANIGLRVWIVPDGVYKINIVVDEKIYSGIWVYFDAREVFESHIFNFESNIYWKKIEIVVFQKIRDNKKFTHQSDLIAQIKADIKTVKSIHNKALTFGTFDVFHPGHEFYLQSARKYWDSLHTIIARDSTVERIKWFQPKDNEKTRQKNVVEFGICEAVILWDKTNPLVPVVQIEPDIICLGYDQKSFPDQLNSYVDQTWIEIIRMNSFEPEIYKSSKLK